MKKEDMIAIGNMKLQGKSAGAIAGALGLLRDTAVVCHKIPDRRRVTDR